jgi:hypothetical protein
METLLQIQMPPNSRVHLLQIQDAASKKKELHTSPVIIDR